MPIQAQLAFEESGIDPLKVDPKASAGAASEESDKVEHGSCLKETLWYSRPM